MLRRLGVLALCLGVGCTDPTGLRNDIRLTITGGYEWSGIPPLQSVTFTISNHGSIAAYLPRCGNEISTEVEQFENGAWVNRSGAFCLTEQSMAPLRLEPGAEVTSSRKVGVSGQYRLRTGVAADNTSEFYWKVFSDPFTLP